MGWAARAATVGPGPRFEKGLPGTLPAPPPGSCMSPCALISRHDIQESGVAPGPGSLTGQSLVPSWKPRPLHMWKSPH